VWTGSCALAVEPTAKNPAMITLTVFIVALVWVCSRCTW
jgi:hypothetical protein